MMSVKDQPAKPMIKNVLDMKQANCIEQRYRDLVFGYIQQIQVSFPMDLKQMILLYYYYRKLFETKILSDQEQDEFIDFLKVNNKTIINYPWKLIYDSSKLGLFRNKFIVNVQYRKNILLLIKLRSSVWNEECIIGGYTSVGWTTKTAKYRCEYGRDKDAFIFYFKSNYSDQKPFISNVKRDSIDSAVASHYCDYGIFGNRIFHFTSDIWGDRFRQLHYTYDASGYDDFPDGIPMITGSKTFNDNIKNVKLEVFQIAKNV